MTARQKRTTAKKPLSYDPARIADETATVESYVSVNITDEDGNETGVMVPRLPERTEDEIKREAIEYARALRRVDAAWRHDLSPEEVDNLLEPLAEHVANIITTNLVDVLTERAGEKEMVDLLGGDAGLEAVIDAATTRNRERILQTIRDADPARLVRDIEKEAVTAILLDLEEREGPELRDLDEAEYDKRFAKAYEELGAERLANALSYYAQHIARVVLEDLNPAEIELGALVDLLKPRDGKADDERSALTGGDVYMPVDEGFRTITRWVAGHEKPTEYRDGYAVLPVVRKRFYEQALHVREDPAYFAEIVSPQDVEPVLARVQQERNETKAKTLVAAFALACDPRNRSPESFPVGVHDLVNLISGYERSGPRKTRSDYYERKLAEVLRYLHADLASLQVNIRVATTTKNRTETMVVGEYLMHRPRLAAEQEFAYPELYDQLRTLIITGQEGSDEAKQALSYLKRLKPTHVYLGFPRTIMATLGHDKGALEAANRGVLQLNGPTFWLAYDVAFRRRWSDPAKMKTGHGVPLLDELERHGFTAESRKRTGGRPSYKHALSAFFSSIDQLLDLGELDEPGVKIWRPHGGPGRPKDVAKELRQWTTQRGKRVTEQDLEDLRVLYNLPEERMKALAALRRSRKPRRKKSAIEAGRG